MFEFLDSISVHYLLLFAIIMALAPFQPEPHLIEKLRMLKEGTLIRPLDIFDLVFHSFPIIVFIMKIIRILMIK